MNRTWCKAHGVGRVLLGGAVLLGISLAVCCLATEIAPASAALPLSGNTSVLGDIGKIGKVFGSLLVVVGLMLVLLYFIKRTGLGSGRGRGSSAIVVLETRMVAPKKYVAIVDIAGKCLAVGITEHNINLLADLGPEVKAALSPQTVGGGAGSAFAGLLSKSMKAWQAAAPGHADLAMKSHKDTQESP